MHVGFAEVTPQRWSDRHTRDKVEDHYFDADGLVRWRQVPEFIITTEFDHDSSDDESSTDESDESSDDSSESDED